MNVSIHSFGSPYKYQLDSVMLFLDFVIGIKKMENVSRKGVLVLVNISSSSNFLVITL